MSLIKGQWRCLMYERVPRLFRVVLSTELLHLIYTNIDQKFIYYTDCWIVK